jgi:hypothetical protein
VDEEAVDLAADRVEVVDLVAEVRLSAQGMEWGEEEATVG